VKDIARNRGPAREAYLIDALKQSPWMHARALSGIKGVNEMLVEYARLIDRLADLWRFPMLRLLARPENYEARTDARTPNLAGWSSGLVLWQLSYAHCCTGSCTVTRFAAIMRLDMRSSCSSA
jgi:hypothetical protein